MITDRKYEIAVMHHCGHEVRYASDVDELGSFAQEVPVMCPDCEAEADLLQCAICKGDHTKEESVISIAAGGSAGRKCLEERASPAGYILG